MLIIFENMDVDMVLGCSPPVKFVFFGCFLMSWINVKAKDRLDLGGANAYAPRASK